MSADDRIPNPWPFVPRMAENATLFVLVVGVFFFDVRSFGPEFVRLDATTSRFSVSRKYHTNATAREANIIFYRT